MNRESKNDRPAISLAFFFGMSLLVCGCENSAKDEAEDRNPDVTESVGKKLSSNATHSSSAVPTVVLEADGTILINGDQIAPEKIDKAFMEKSRQLAESGIGSGNVTVRLVPRANVTYGTLQRVYQSAYESNFDRFELHAPTRKYSQLYERIAKPSDTFTEPLSVHVKANPDGTIAGIVCADLSGDLSFDSIDELQEHVRAYLGPERGRGSIQPESEANFSADDQLHFSHFAKVLDAVAFESNARDARPLIAFVWPWRSRQPPLDKELKFELDSDQYQEPPFQTPPGPQIMRLPR